VGEQRDRGKRSASQEKTRRAPRAGRNSGPGSICGLHQPHSRPVAPCRASKALATPRWRSTFGASRRPTLLDIHLPAFCTALRASRLVTLKLGGVRLWESLADSLAVIAACTGHPTLRTLGFQSNDLEHAPDRAAIEAALDALHRHPSLSWA